MANELDDKFRVMVDLKVKGNATGTIFVRNDLKDTIQRIESTNEDRVVGIKSREIYEAPGLLLLIKAHKELESITLNPDVLDFKNLVEKKCCSRKKVLFFVVLIKIIRSYQMYMIH